MLKIVAFNSILVGSGSPEIDDIGIIWQFRGGLENNKISLDSYMASKENLLSQILIKYVSHLFFFLSLKLLLKMKNTSNYKKCTLNQVKLLDMAFILQDYVRNNKKFSPLIISKILIISNT